MTKPSWFFWTVGVIALAWSTFGVWDCYATLTNNEAYLAGYPAEMIAWIQAMPAWRVIFWIGGVGGSFAGAVLLLLRNKLAPAAFIISLVCIFVGLVIDLGVLGGWEMYGTAGLLASAFVVILPCVLFLLYARRAADKGWLK